ncbi:BTAD domain-containing putative transcriptional regulator [Streptomyces phaeochromogenes]|uniref:AfsR/SARP family transcriptional regulator n=1 Tax=Streptomyces phaeochromogenes TaxID=1923 RepID=UPI0033C76D0E
MEFRLLGPVEASADGRPVALGHAKQRCVAAVLLERAGQAVPAEQLIDRVWGEDPPETVRNVLYGYIGRLRTAVGATRLVRCSGGYLLEVAPEQVDLHRFRGLVTEARAMVGEVDERAAALLREALGLWRGEALAGLAGAWAEETRGQLAGERRAAQSECLDVELRLGRHHASLGELRALVAANPLDERAVRQLMTALYRSECQGEALSRYETTRKHLADELGVDPGPELQALHQQILLGGPGLAAPTQPARVVRSELPHDVAPFGGRAAELARLDVLQSCGSVAISVISGTAGVGKTALAVHFAHRERARFPDGQLYLDLHGFDPDSQPLSPGKALSRLLRSMGLEPQDILADEDEQIRQYRSLLDGRRMLIVLDNAVSAKQVRPLLPGDRSCRVLVTSRNRLDGLVARNGAHQLTLEVLGPPEAQALLASVLGNERTSAEPEATRELARLCGRLPLALRIAAAQLARDPHRRIADLAAELSADGRLATLELHGDQSSGIRGAFALSYRSLSPEPRRLFRLLGVVPGPDVTAEAGAALLDTTPQRAKHLLRALAAAHLVESPTTGRYRCHDLVREYAAERAQAEESQAKCAAALERLFSFYLRHAQATGSVLPWQYPQLPDDPAGPEPADVSGASSVSSDEAVTWLEAERENLLSAVNHAGRHGPRPFAWQLTTALLRYFWLCLPRASWQATAQAALEAARADGDPFGQAAAHRSLGLAHWDIGQHRQARQHHAHALELHRHTGDALGEALALGGLGLVEAEAAQLDDALGHYRTALHIARTLGRPEVEAQARVGFGVTYRDMGRLADAADHLELALRLYDKAGASVEPVRLPALAAVYWEQGRLSKALTLLGLATDPRDTNPTTLDLLAKIHLDLGRHDEALAYAQHSLRLAEDTGRRRLLAIALTTVADVRTRAGHTEWAARTQEHALRLARETGNRRAEADCLLGLATTCRDEALAYAHQALALARRSGFRVVEGQCLTALAAVHAAQGHPTAALPHARDALTLQQKTGHRLGEARALTVLGNTLHTLGRKTAAEAALQQAHALYTDTGARPPENNTRDLDRIRATPGSPAPRT